ncbi:hypothetical protein H0H92_004369 [Tricholoma furcatifolium]|nr:hypothetical protein H0H92_004369 [Tricholoma furcatifolium]
MSRQHVIAPEELIERLKKEAIMQQGIEAFEVALSKAQKDLEDERDSSLKTSDALQRSIAQRDREFAQSKAELEVTYARVAALNKQITELAAQVEQGEIRLENERTNLYKAIEKLENQVVDPGSAIAHAEKDAEEAEEFEETENELPLAVYDKHDDVERCVECSWEVVEGLCESCGAKHFWDPEDHEGDEPRDSLLMEIAYDSDREQAPRGDTPLLPIQQNTRPIAGYTPLEYIALLQRGATRLMIETFNLEFSEEQGIFAWADYDLYAEFAGSKMREGDRWKIQLGRRFELDGDDYDGSEFIEGLLEETILYPSSSANRWETFEETPGIWVTRMVAVGEEVEESEDDKGDDKDGSDEDGPILRRPGYDTTEDEILDDEFIDGLNNPAALFQVRGCEMKGAKEPAIEVEEKGMKGITKETDVSSFILSEENDQAALAHKAKRRSSTLESNSWNSSDSTCSSFDETDLHSGDEVAAPRLTLLVPVT